MKNIWEDERADSMVIVVIALGTLMFGMLYLFLTNTANLPIEQMNLMIDQGIITTDTASHMSTMIDMWQASPFFFIIGLVLFAFERMKGESVTSGTYFSYLTMMIILLQASAFLVWVMGTSADSLTGMFEDQTTIMNYSADWDVSAERGVVLAGMYYAAMLPAFLGSIMYMIHPILRQRNNDFLEGGDEEDGTQEYISGYSLEQM